MSKPHTDAVLALVTAAAGTTYDAQVPKDRTLPYRVVFTDDGLDTASTLEAVPDLLTVLVRVTAAGLTRASVQITRDLAHAALIGVKPAVSGRSCSPLRQVNARPITEDRDVDPPVLYSVNEYEFFSVPA